MDIRIIVERSENPICLLPNFVKDKSLSLEAKGLFCLLQLVDQISDFDELIELVRSNSSASDGIGMESLGGLVMELKKGGYII